MKNKVDVKVCGVCSDKALGYNFNAVTCESCKAFFRRNALVQKEFKCPFNNKCDITTVTRRFCQKCRLDKCFAIGMCKDLIMSEQDKFAKRQKIVENRAKKRYYGTFKSGFKKMKKEVTESSSQEVDFYTTSYIKDSKDINSSQGVCESNNCNLVSVINYNTECTRESREKTPSPLNERLVSSSDDILSTSNTSAALNPNQNNHEGDTSCVINILNNYDLNCNNNFNNLNNVIAPHDPVYRPSIDNITKDVVNDVQRIHSFEQGPLASILCEAIKLEFESFPSVAQFNSNSRDLNDAERAKLNELIVASKSLLSPIDEELKNLIGDKCKEKQLNADPALVDVVNLTAIGIRRLIKMAKKINAFKNMCQEDQVALLKGGCTEIMLLRSAMNYDEHQQIWQIPHTMQALKVNVDVLKLAKGNIYQLHHQFIENFEHKWRTDENIILILCAVLLFTPDRQRVVHNDVIKLEQNSYYYLLRRYLESIYPGCEAKSTFLKLIHKIAEIHKVNKEFINVYLGVNPSEVEPLLIEIFDLKSKPEM